MGKGHVWHLCWDYLRTKGSDKSRYEGSCTLSKDLAAERISYNRFRSTPSYSSSGETSILSRPTSLPRLHNTSSRHVRRCRRWFARAIPGPHLPVSNSQPPRPVRTTTTKGNVVRGGTQRAKLFGVLLERAPLNSGDGGGRERCRCIQPIGHGAVGLTDCRMT